VHLVSSSVPDLAPKAVSVLDQSGALLTESPDGKHSGGLDAQQLQYVAQIESNYMRRIVDLLEPVVGRDNLRAQVTADIDFSQRESTSEQFRPNQGAEPAAVRSQQTLESNLPGAATATGVPGAATNEPPVGATAPINGPAQALQTAGAATPAQVKREAVVNYEVDKTVRVTRDGSGTIRRVNAAVVVNHRTVAGPSGKPVTSPLSEEELQNLTALVRESVGFNAERGDSVRVINAPFRIEKIETPEIPLWQQPETRDFLRAAAVPATLAVLALVIAFGVVRPALRAANERQRGRQIDAVVADTEVLPALVAEAPPSAQLLAAPDTLQKLEAARQLARDNPGAVANIVRGWVTKEAVKA
jgi:flagellar M-ring protein FliF